jgi:hypothetical protein
MSAAERLEGGVSFEELVAEGFDGTRQGAVIIVESRAVPTARHRWLARQVEALAPDGVVHAASDGLIVVLLRHAGPGETWVVVERMRRGLMRSGWEHTVVGSATWPVQGSTPMDVIAAALASLYDERERCEALWLEQELTLAVDDRTSSFASAGELLTG